MTDIDIWPPKEEESTRLMVHHLSLAAAFFEATEDDWNLAEALIEEELSDFAKPAAKKFVQELVRYYRAANRWRERWDE